LKIRLWWFSPIHTAGVFCDHTAVEQRQRRDNDSWCRSDRQSIANSSGCGVAGRPPAWITRSFSAASLLQQ
jgi:hypothetical protein